MLAAENLGISYGPRRLFGEVNFTICAGDRISLAGPNGAGKSTLLKIIAGIEQGDEGRIVKARSVQIGYLPQEGIEVKGRTLVDEAQLAFQDVLKLQEELDIASEALSALDPQSQAYSDALEAFGDLQIRLEHHDISRMRSRIERVLIGLGFSHQDLDRMTDEFSGGWQMRIALAKLLLAQPSVLLLDEPTNHLDIDTIVWLEDYLKSYPGAIVLISHDRRFLDVLTNRTLAFEQGRVQLYSGNYSFFLKESISRRQQLERAKANQDREIAKTQAFIDRFRAKASKATQAQSRIKMLEKVERIELESDDTEISFRFPQPPPSGQTVIRLAGISKSYDGVKWVLKPFDFEISKGDRLAIVGVNGAGKTTFSKILAGVEQPTEGLCELGHKVSIGYYSQDHADALDGNHTVLETVERVAKGLSSSEIRTLLGCFLFKGDDVFKLVKVLSGGERGRLALASMLLTPSNFLVLDEPTNHLDMRSQQVLQQALLEYTGSYAIVSHNRDFLDPVVSKTLEFRVGESPRLYQGNLSYYLEKRAEELKSHATPSFITSPQATTPSSSNFVSGKEKRRLEAERRQQRTKVLAPLEKSFADTELAITALESEKMDLEKTMSSPEFGNDSQLSLSSSKRYAEVDSELNEKYQIWSELSEEIEKLKQKLNDL